MLAPHTITMVASGVRRHYPSPTSVSGNNSGVKQADVDRRRRSTRQPRRIWAGRRPPYTFGT
jgi:hypothetical protein